MPETIMVDVSNLQIGHAIKVRDLQFDDYELVSAKELVICGVKATRASANAAATEGDEEAAE